MHIHTALLFNSRTAIAGAIIGLLLVFLQFKEFELYWGAVFFFYDSKRSIGFLKVFFFFTGSTIRSDDVLT